MSFQSTIPAHLKGTPLAEKQPIVSGNTLRYEVGSDEIKQVIRVLMKELHFPLKTVVATDERTRDGSYHVLYVFGIPKERGYVVPFVKVPQEAPQLLSLVDIDHTFSLYEKEIYTFFGIELAGNPRPTRIRLHEENFTRDVYPLRKDVAWNAQLAREKPDWSHVPPMREYKGDGVYEVSVGPVHAGIIEPGHFRASLIGEEVLALDTRFGYVHKGVEKLFEHLPDDKRLRLSERISGDSTVSHALAYVQALEAVARHGVPARGRLLRVVYAELERLASHLNDIGFIMLDTGFSFGGAHGARLRERVMQLCERLTGSRFMRGEIVLGGVRTDLKPEVAAMLLSELEALQHDFDEVIAASLHSESLLNRMENTGALQRQAAIDHGVVGVAARALGVHTDARVDFPYAAYDELSISVHTETDGDVYARFKVRVAEVGESFAIIRSAIKRLQNEKSPIAAKMPASLPAGAAAVGMVEGWRGDIVYYIATDAKGHIMRVKVRDPSFLNWRVYPYTAPADIIADFPLINKSYNLSYSGNDL
jgi:Ni,Fe-hydrogenase III large subunit/Ni,Fe-hydrogenase III component G